MTERIVDSTELTALTKETFDPAVMFEPMKVETMLALIEEKAVDFKADISTRPGQDKFRSQAFTVAKIRTAWIKEGKDQNRAINIEVKERNAQCNKIDERLSAMQAKVRQPLTDLENAIKIEEAEHKRLMLILGERKNCPSDLSVDELSSLLDKTKEIEITGDILGDNYSAATTEKELAVSSLQGKLDARVKHDEDQAELAKLRAEREEREKEEAQKKKKQKQVDREEQIRKEAAAKAKKEAAEKLVKKEAARKKAVQDKKDAAKEAEQARITAAKKAEADKKAAVAAAEKKAKEEAEQKERDRLAKIEIKRLTDEKRAADKKHRAKIDKEIEKALVGMGMAKEVAKNLIPLLATGNIPHTTINY